MKINIGDYVRTNDGCICKIININDFREPSMKYGVEAGYFKDIMFIGDENIIKSSPDIIDLIEYDDILKIVYKDKEYICKVINVLGVRGVQLTSTLSVGLGIVEAGIKSIITHEMFESMEYKIGE